jgi:hypothetical protein
MASEVWNQDPDEAYANPYERAIQAQFMREAELVLARSYRLLNSEQHRYTRSETSLRKAVWMLHVDALDSLRDALDALRRKNHRVAAKLLRDILESLDVAAYFHEASPKSSKDLARWYDNGFVLHGRYRDHLAKTGRENKAVGKAALYQSLSAFTHRTYVALLEGYSLGAGERLVHDAIGETVADSTTGRTALVLQETIASYLAFLAKFIMYFLDEIVRCKSAPAADVEAALLESMEAEPAKRRFTPRPSVAERIQARRAAEEEGPKP